MAVIWIAGGIALVSALSVFSFWLGAKFRASRARDHLSGLHEVGNDLTGSAEQVATVSRDILNSSDEQLEALASTVTASHEIRSMIEKTLENVENLRSHANQLMQGAQEGSLAVENMVQSSQAVQAGMDHFNREMQQSMIQMSQALEVIKEIASKTEVINTIVFQTKLLSFNASVEAARAGEAGKGFSVVAEEIGKLAQLSGHAAREISEIVERSVKVVEQATQSTKDKIELLSSETQKKSDLGFSNAKTCESVFRQMTEQVQETNQMIEYISQASSEQAEGVGQLDQSILRFQEAADRNRLIASQSSEHSREFQRQSRTLSDLIRKCSNALGARKVFHALKGFVWSPQLELGEPQMDHEHQILVGKINELVSELEKQRSRKNLPLLKKVFDDLAAYTAEHFAHEEKFLGEIQYPQLHSHKKIHENLLNQVASFGRELEQGTLEDTKLVSFLRNWLLSHIMGVDRQYANFHKAQQQPSHHKKSAA